MVIKFSNKKSGWHKDMPIRKRRRLVLISTSHGSMSSKVLEAARKMQALANITNDRRTKLEAEKDAHHFFNLYQRLK